MDCFVAFTISIVSGRIVPVELNLNARDGNRPATVVATAGLGEAVGPESRAAPAQTAVSGQRRSSGSQADLSVTAAAGPPSGGAWRRGRQLTLPVSHWQLARV